MYSGWLHKRSSAVGPPPLGRRFCVLWGSQLWDFSNQEQAEGGRPETVVEVLVRTQPVCIGAIGVTWCRG